MQGSDSVARSGDEVKNYGNMCRVTEPDQDIELLRTCSFIKDFGVELEFFSQNGAAILVKRWSWIKFSSL